MRVAVGMGRDAHEQNEPKDIEGKKSGQNPTMGKWRKDFSCTGMQLHNQFEIV